VGFFGAMDIAVGLVVFGPLQTPAAHFSPDLHFLPQLPQCEASFLVFTHAPEHLVSVFLHAVEVGFGFGVFIEVDMDMDMLLGFIEVDMDMLLGFIEVDMDMLLGFIEVDMDMLIEVDIPIELGLEPLQTPAAHFSPDLHFLPHEPQ